MTETLYADSNFLLQCFCCPYGTLVQSELQVATDTDQVIAMFEVLYAAVK